MQANLTRRQLIHKASLSAGLGVLGGVISELPARASKSPNEKLNIACIGVGGQGGGDIGHWVTENIVAVCDVDEARAADSFKRFSNAKRYKDFRKMLDEMGKSIDAVSVSTPDHIHATATCWALKMDKHVYCQKPLTRTVWEARTVMETARKHKVATQMGTQGHAFPATIRAVEYLEKGVIGIVKEVHVVTDRPAGWWPQGILKPQVSMPVPPTLDWDLWLGPAAERPYNSAYLPFVWRGWWDFGTGAPGDMACHLMDIPFWALKLGYPTKVTAEGEPRMPDTGPLSSKITFEFPARGEMPAVTVNWYDGDRFPSADVLDGIKMSKGFNGSLYIGTKGKMLVSHSEEPALLPAAQFADFKGPDPYIPRPKDHYQQWIDACKNGTPTGSNFEYAATMTESVLLGNVAFRTGKVIEWDAKHMRAKSVPEADQYIRPAFRKGWHL